jgi:serine/threonine protein kinase
MESDLDKYLRRHGTLTEELAAQSIVPILDTLARMHGFGIIHRDIKASNILLRKADDPTSVCVGDFTSCYVVPPEQDSDQLAGKFTFPPKPDVSDAGKAFIRRLLQIDPNLRPSTVEALADPWLANAVSARGAGFVERFHTLTRPDSSGASHVPSGGTIRAPVDDKTAPEDAAFSTLFFESGVRVSFDSASGSLVIADPKVLIKAAAAKAAAAERETDDSHSE